MSSRDTAPGLAETGDLDFETSRDRPPTSPKRVVMGEKGLYMGEQGLARSSSSVSTNVTRGRLVFMASVGFCLVAVLMDAVSAELLESAKGEQEENPLPSVLVGE